MNKADREALEAAGYRVFDDAADFLGLTAEERRLVELRVAISRAIRARRKRKSLTQLQVAKQLKTSQPRYARIEAGAPGVSFDLMFRALFAQGGTMQDLRMSRQAPAGPRAARQPDPVKLGSRKQAASAHQPISTAAPAARKQRRRLLPV
jgi:transcriptional regulator with XRE-family HTH domain